MMTLLVAGARKQIDGVVAPLLKYTFISQIEITSQRTPAPHRFYFFYTSTLKENETHFGVIKKASD